MRLGKWTAILSGAAMLPMITSCGPNPATDTCGSKPVVAFMLEKVQHSFTYLSVEAVMLATNGQVGQDGHRYIKRVLDIIKVRTENYDKPSRRAYCSATLYFRVAPAGKEDAPIAEWSVADMRFKYTVSLTDDGNFNIDEDDWDWVK